MPLPCHSVQWDITDGLTHTFQNPASIWKCKKLSQNRETLGIIQLHSQDRYSRAVSTQDKKPQLGVLASPCSCCQAPWHGLCTRLCTQGLAVQETGFLCPKQHLVPIHQRHQIDKSRALFKATIKVISLSSFCVLCTFLLHAGQFHLVTKLNTEQG